MPTGQGVSDDTARPGHISLFSAQLMQIRGGTEAKEDIEED
jgi:hypothetical protein